MNDKDKQLFSAVSDAFDSAATALNDIAADVTDLVNRFGAEGKITKRRQAQLAVLRTLYDSTLEYINHLRDLNKRMSDEVVAREIIAQKKCTGLPYANIATLMGISDPDDLKRWQQLDKLDGIIERARSVVGNQDGLTALISYLKK